MHPSLPDKKTVFVLLTVILILLLAAYTRFFHLGDIPRGLNWDEVSYAFNARSLLLTGKDEWGNPFPLFLRAFGDFKPALLSYLQMALLSVVQPSDFVVRFPVALLGWLSVPALGWFFWRITKRISFGLLGMFLITVTPWHIHYSRAAMDPIPGLSFLILGLALLVVKKNWTKMLGIVMLVISMYTYNAERFLIPLAAAATTLFLILDSNYRRHWRSWLPLIVALAVGTGLLFSLSIKSGANSRAEAVFAINESALHKQVTELFFRSSVVGLPAPRLFTNKVIVASYDFAKRYLSHWSPEFFFFDGNLSARHASAHHGNLLLLTLPLFLLGIFRPIITEKRVLFGQLVWLLLAPVPSALTTDVPHSGRTLVMIVPMIFFAAGGILSLISLVRERWQKVVIGLAVLGAITINFWWYWRDYQIFFPEDSEYAWQGHLRSLSDRVMVEKNRSWRDIYVTADGNHPAIFFAWYWQLDPTQWQIAQGRHDQWDNLNIATISTDHLGCLLLEQDTLVVTLANSVQDQQALPNSKISAFNRFYLPDDLFYIYETSNLVRPNLKEIMSHCEAWKKRASS